MQDLISLGKTQREVRRQLAILQSDLPEADHPPDYLSRLRWQTKSSEAAALLLKIARSPRGKEEVTRRLTKGSRNRQRTLRSLFSLSDMEATVNRPLQKSAQSARLLAIILESSQSPKVVKALHAYLKDGTVKNGAAGVRFSLKSSTSITQAIPNLGSILLEYVERLISTAPDHAMRLLELVFRRHLSDFRQLKPTALARIRESLMADHACVPPAALHLVRTLTTSPPPGFLDHDVLSSMSRITLNAHDPKFRCLAFSTMPVLLKYVSPPKYDMTLLHLCVDVLLWKIPWQHAISKDDTVRPYWLMAWFPAY